MRDNREAAFPGFARIQQCLRGLLPRRDVVRNMESDGHVDMLYVHPDFQRRGVARALLAHVEELARVCGLVRLYTEASITGRPAFEALGFCVLGPQTVTVRGETMTNYRMEKKLATAVTAE